MKKHQRLAIGMFMACISVPLFAQNEYGDFGPFSFFLTPKVLKDGSITELGLGYDYTERSSGELRLRFSNEAKNEQFDETVPDSLNAVDKSGFALFLIPYHHFFAKSPRIRFQAGPGIYYNYDKLSEKGYFNMPSLAALGKEKVNSFSNDLSTHMLGPTIETALVCRTGRIEFSLHGGVIPVFYLHTSQDMSIVPLLEPDSASYEQDTWGSPGFFADINFIMFKYVSLALLYDFFRLNYKVVDFNDNLKWYNPDRAVISQSLKLEVSLLIPLQGSVYTQVGYGYTFDSIQLDSASPVQSNRHYLIFSTRVKK
jgi:hypothetical protein